jgi:2-C-methyl-D-erythritol 2,4-cyclodiphosphate synthase
MNNLKIGYGFDVHKISPGKGIVIGGLSIPCDYSLVAHSDGDVLSHAIIDALLSATGQRDIGYFFPDTDPSLKGASSLEMLSKVWSGIKDRYSIQQADFTLVLDSPIMQPFWDDIRKNISKVLSDLEVDSLSFKAKRTEGVAFVGGVAAMGVVVLCKK